MIQTLHPSIQGRARAFLSRAKQEGFNLRITHAYRSIAEQNALWEQGRKRPGQIVTNARGGQSFHNFGLAFDVVDTIKGYNINWDALGDIARSVGLEHGDRGMVDKPHFQWRDGLTLAQVQKGARPAIPAPAQPTNNDEEEDMKRHPFIHERYTGRYTHPVKNAKDREVWITLNEGKDRWIVSEEEMHETEFYFDREFFPMTKAELEKTWPNNKGVWSMGSALCKRPWLTFLEGEESRAPKDRK